MDELETIATEEFKLIVAAQERINRKLKEYGEYKKLRKMAKLLTGEDTYEKVQKASDYFFNGLKQLSDKRKEAIKSYKEK